MNLEEQITLIRDTRATIIPAGDEHLIPKGTVVSISQALGGAVTIRADNGLYRIPSKDWDALGEEINAHLKAKESEETVLVPDVAFSESLVWSALRQCFDPEIPLNIVDLGLIYDLKISEKNDQDKHEVKVQMTLTAQGCGMGPVIAEDAQKQIEKIPEVDSAEVAIVWEPPWNPHMISDEGRQTLGLE